MPKFRKKPVVVEAIQWIPGELVQPAPSVPDTQGVIWEYDPEGNVSNGVIETLEGKMIVLINDWVITGIQGEKYPCKPDIFEATYEPV